MNIWDSVQRGLEKATQEATRIAKLQRLRATIDGLSKQIETQQRTIVVKAMELFTNGQLTQNELLVLCQELSNFQHQFAQAQSELKQVQSQSNQGSQAVQPNTTVAYTQPPYQPYDSTLPSLVPPPPPGVETPTISSFETMRMTPPSTTEQMQCAVCQAVLVPGNAFCHNCGTPVNSDAFYQPTVRANMSEGNEAGQNEKTLIDAAEQATIRAEEEVNSSAQEKRQDGGI